MDAAARYHPLAWTAAVALGATGWAAHFSYSDFADVLAAVSAIALVAWVAAKWVARLRRRTPSRSLAQAVQLSLATFALAAFGLYAAVLHVLGFIFVYPEPTKNRAYAESMGLEFGPYMLVSLAASVLIAIVALLAIRALRTADPARAASLWLCCVLAPATWLGIGTASSALAEGLKTSEFGADLPASVLLTIEFTDYRTIPMLVALGLLGLAAFWRARPERFRWTVFAQILVLLLGGAFFAFTISSAALLLFSMCGGAI